MALATQSREIVRCECRSLVDGSRSDVVDLDAGAALAQDAHGMRADNLTAKSLPPGTTAQAPSSQICRAHRSLLLTLDDLWRHMATSQRSADGAVDVGLFCGHERNP